MRVSTALTAANSAWECVDGRVWGASAITVCVSAGSRMFWSVSINNSLGRREAEAGTGEKHYGQVKAGGKGEPGVDGGQACGSGDEGQQGASCCFLS